MAERKTSRKRAMRRSPSTRGLRPALMAPSTAMSARPVSRSHSAATSSLTASRSSEMPPAATTWSSADSMSRAEPAPARTTYSIASGVTSSPASSTMYSASLRSSSAESRWTSNCCVRLRMVGSTFSGSVVASTNTTWSGGSSSVFSSVLDAAVDSMWTSSRMYTFVRPGEPIDARLMRSRMASMPLLEAASSSWTSKERPSSMATHESQTPHGSPSMTSVQFRTLPRMRAVEVLPVPRGPLKR